MDLIDRGLEAEQAVHFTKEFHTGGWVVLRVCDTIALLLLRLECRLFQYSDYHLSRLNGNFLFDLIMKKKRLMKMFSLIDNFNINNCLADIYKRNKKYFFYPGCVGDV